MKSTLNYYKLDQNIDNIEQIDDQKGKNFAKNYIFSRNSPQYRQNIENSEQMYQNIVEI